MTGSPATSTPATSTPSTRGKMSLLAGLYISQFLGVGFFFTALVAILRDGGVPLEQIALINALGLAWALKFLWAPLVDRIGPRRSGHYRAWLLVLQPAIVVGLLVLLPIDPIDDRGLLFLVAAIVVLLSATQDIAADAIAVRLLEPAQLGTANGIQTAAGFVGNLVGGGLVLVVYDRFGWAAAIVTLAVATALPILQVAAFREPARDQDERPTTGETFAALLTVFRLPGVAVWVFAVMPLFFAGISGAYGLVTPMLVDAGWSLTAIGITLNVVAGSAAILGALVAGPLVARWGRRRALVTFAVVQAVAIPALLPLATGTAPLVPTVAVLCLTMAGYAAASTVLYTVCMDLCRRSSAGTDYTMMASVTLVVSFVVTGIVVALAGVVGYAAMILVCTGVGVLGALAARLLFVDTSGSRTATTVDEVRLTA